MRITFTVGQALLGSLALAVLSLAWFFFAPAVLGGRTAYVVTEGISMQPHLHGGDLVLVRGGGSSYGVGDVVAYRSRFLGTVVLHRIVAQSGGRYVFKGDNNDFVDPERPTRGQLVGEAWIRVPRLGTLLETLRTPGVIGVLVMVAVLLLGARRTRRRDRRRPGGERRRALPLRLPAAVSNRALLVAAVAWSLPFAVLAGVSFARPAAGLVPVRTGFVQSGTFSYSGAAAAGPVYPHGRIATGDTVFLRLADTLAFGFAYRFSSEVPHALAGSAALRLRVVSSTGWKRTTGLGRRTSFAGDRVVVRGSLNLRSLSLLLQRLETATSVPGTYTLTLLADVRVNGMAKGIPVRARYSPSLAFALDPRTLKPVLGNGAAAPGGASAASVLKPTAPGTASAERRAPLSFSLAGLRVGVASARRLSVLGLAALLCAWLGFGFGRTGDRRPPDEVRSIQARYGRWLVPVERIQRGDAQHVVDVDAIGALVKIAARYDRMILHETRAGLHTYCVADDGILYRYSLSGPARLETLPAPPGRRSA